MKATYENGYMVFTTDHFSEYIITTETLRNETLAGFEYKANEDGESVTIIKYIGDSGDVVIPSEIDGKKVTIIGDKAFYNCAFLTSIKIPDSVIYIGVYAFARCTSLTSVEVPDSVEKIEGGAFYN